MVLVAKFQPGRSADPSAVAVERRPKLRWLRFVGVLWLLAYAEELLWDCGLWHDRSWLFGPAWNIGDWDQVLVPLLAVPQITHYVLDGFIWRRRSNQDVGEVLQLTRSVSEGECSK